VSERLVVVVSGGSKGLGRGIVEALLGAGHTVVTYSRSETPFVAERAAADPERARFWWEAIDATDRARVSQLVLDVARRYGRIDGVVNNAGMAVESVLPLAREADMHAMLATNLESTIHLAQAASRVMLRQRAGSIVNVSSIVGMRGYSGLSIYSATKGAIDAFTRALARELGPRGIRVNSIAPGYVDTDLSATLDPAQRDQIVRRTPLGRLATVSDIAGPVLFLLSPAARHITGTTLVVDGGITC
jgi:3-oxoacyl-[acyl-carrier protein] reductase